jgi:peptide/nickel transport system permease protein
VERLRLDQPFILRSIDYLQQAMRLDLGRAEQMHSDRGAREVYWIIVERLPATLLLFGTANLLVFFTSVFVALGLSRRYGSALDRTGDRARPELGGAGVVLRHLPDPDLRVPGPRAARWRHGGRAAAGGHAGLRAERAAAHAAAGAAMFISHDLHLHLLLAHLLPDPLERGLRGDGPGQGPASRLIERRYILRPTLSPIITSFALMLIGLWSGAIILEQVFNWPGLGTLLFQAIGHRDTPVIIGTVVIFAYLLAITVFLLDILYALLDPRVRVERRPRA